MPVVDMLGQIYKKDIQATLYTDSSAALAAVEKGASPNMRYLRKNHRVSLGCARDYIIKVGIEHKKIDGESNVADIFTKPLSVLRHQALAKALGVMPSALASSQPVTLL
jgi:hypothetical protein